MTTANDEWGMEHWEELLGNFMSSYQQTGQWYPTMGPTPGDFVKYLGQDYYNAYAKYVYGVSAYRSQAYYYVEGLKQQEQQYYASQNIKSMTLSALQSQYASLTSALEEKLATEAAQREQLLQEGEIAKRDELQAKYDTALEVAQSELSQAMNYKYYMPQLSGVKMGSIDTNQLISDRLADYITQEEYDTLVSLSEKRGAVGEFAIPVGTAGAFESYASVNKNSIYNISGQVNKNEEDTETAALF